MYNTTKKENITLEKIDNALLQTAAWLKELTTLKQELEKEKTNYLVRIK